MFQSSPPRVGGCDAPSAVAWVDETCFNPHPPGWGGATLISRRAAPLSPPGFNPHPPGWGGATALPETRDVHQLVFQSSPPRVGGCDADRVLGQSSKAYEWLKGRYLPLIAEWARGLLTGKRRSIDLLGGRFSFRAQADSVAVTDAPAFCAWALENRPDLVKVEPKKSAVNDAWKAGLAFEDAPGIEHRPGVEKFSVSFPGMPEEQDA